MNIAHIIETCKIYEEAWDRYVQRPFIKKNILRDDYDSVHNFLKFLIESNLFYEIQIIISFQGLIISDTKI